MTHSGVRRNPSEESVDIYPGLVVHDGRVSGSITIGQSRLPLWAICSTAIHESWSVVEEGWEPSRYDYTASDFSGFIHCLLEARGEFGRLLLEIANADRLALQQEDQALQAAADNNHPGVKSYDDGAIVANVTPGDDDAVTLPGPWWKNPELKQPVIAQLKRCLEALEDD